MNITHHNDILSPSPTFSNCIMKTVLCLDIVIVALSDVQNHVFVLFCFQMALTVLGASSPFPEVVPGILVSTKFLPAKSENLWSSFIKIV